MGRGERGGQCTFEKKYPQDINVDERMQEHGGETRQSLTKVIYSIADYQYKIMSKC